MAEVMNMPAESLDLEPTETAGTADGTPPPPPPPPPPLQLQPAAAQRRRDRDSRERRDDMDRDRDRDFDPRAPGRHRGGGGNYYDRNLSPPPPRDRERDYKRRRSPSPPPYRERRRSPPPFKRSRRGDGGFGRHRSPRGGFGPEERRYDYGGRYERAMGDRPGFPDSYGRFMNRGPPELESKRGGYIDSMDTGSTQREGLMSYKQFIQELEDDILPAEAERRYQEYRTEYISTQKHAFFDAHKDEEWLKDKYHPTNLVKVIERRNRLASYLGLRASASFSMSNWRMTERCKSKVWKFLNTRGE